MKNTNPTSDPDIRYSVSEDDSSDNLATNNFLDNSFSYSENGLTQKQVEGETNDNRRVRESVAGNAGKVEVDGRGNSAGVSVAQESQEWGDIDQKVRVQVTKLVDAYINESPNWNFLVYVHGSLLLWALLFVVSLLIPDGGKTASVLAVGNALFLFVNIPLAVFSFILKAKDRFSIEYESPVVVLSILNTIVGIILWIFVVLLAQSPKFG